MFGCKNEILQLKPQVRETNQIGVILCVEQDE